MDGRQVLLGDEAVMPWGLSIPAQENGSISSNAQLDAAGATSSTPTNNPLAYTGGLEYVSQSPGGSEPNVSFTAQRLWDFPTTSSHFEVSTMMDWHGGDSDSLSVSDTLGDVTDGRQMTSLEPLSLIPEGHYSLGEDQYTLVGDQYSLGEDRYTLVGDQYTLSYPTAASYSQNTGNQFAATSWDSLAPGNPEAQTQSPGTQPQIRRKTTKWHELPPQSDPSLEAKRQRAIKGRKNRERIRVKEKELTETLNNVTEDVQKLISQRERLQTMTTNLQSHLIMYRTKGTSAVPAVPAQSADYLPRDRRT
nr:uncharacterized protein LOC128702044 [Cherax quadricarinatus]